MDADLYVPGDGWLHRADPRVKFLITVVMLVLCLVWRNWAFILDVLIIEHLMLITDGVPLKRIGWVWKILAVIIVFIVVLWPIFDPSGTHVLWQWGWLKLTRENLVMAAVFQRKGDLILNARAEQLRFGILLHVADTFGQRRYGMTAGVHAVDFHQSGHGAVRQIRDDSGQSHAQGGFAGAGRSNDAHERA